MNKSTIKYPHDLLKLLGETKVIKKAIYSKLLKDDCVKLNELYYKKNISNGYRIYRNTELFNKFGYQANIELKNSKHKNEYKGLYVFGDVIEGKVTPVYVGISRTIFRRLKQHGWGKKHNECSLAYLMAKKDDLDLSRSTSNAKKLDPKKKIVKDFKVALYPIMNDYELYFHEVALAGLFKTTWNNFRTH